MVVANCGHCAARISPTDRFCAQCGAFVGRRCSVCDATLPAGAEFCDSCGTTLQQPEPAVADLPAHSRVKGERKHVTVLFADVVGSTDLVSGLGPERTRWLIEAVVDRMKLAIEAFGGTLNQVMGDGIMALFGAPRALEDHALRACHAALRIQETVADSTFSEASGHRISIRVGLHSGEAVVTERGHGFDHQYTAFGLAIHTAARLEQAAQANQILLSSSTYDQVSGRISVERQGLQRLKGLAEPVEIFALLSVAQIDAAERRPGIGSAFIGRESILFMLGSFAVAAREHRGRAVVVVGEAGSGKSRLCEKVTREIGTDFLLIRLFGVSSPPQPPYAGVVKALFDCIGTGSTGPDVVREWLAALNIVAPDHTDALRSLLISTEHFDSPAWRLLSYKERQVRIEAAFVYVLRRAAADRPILLLIDDLQWIDDASVDVFAVLSQRVGDTRILVLANARTGAVPASMRDAGPMLIQLDTFTKDETYSYLENNLARGTATEFVKRRLFELTGGNVFFLEQAIKAFPNRPLDGQLRNGTISLQVQDLLAMRIDHLPTRSKTALQAAAVLGMEMESSHLIEVAGLRRDEIEEITASLIDAAFLSPSSDGSRRLAFRHILGRDAVYSGLLHENRSYLHARVLAVLEATGGQEPSLLAFHAKFCSHWKKAYQYAITAGRRSLDRASPVAALSLFMDALGSLELIAPDPTTMRAELDLRFVIRNTLFSLGRALEIGEHLLAARQLAETLGDEAGQARALCQSAHHAWQMGRWEDAMETGQAALRFATATGDLGLQVSSIFFMGLAAYALGRFRTGAELLDRNVLTLTGTLATERFGFVSVCSVVSGSYLATCLTELGEYDKAEQAARQARDTAAAVGSAFDRIQADLALAGVSLMQGNADQVPLLESALSLCRSASVTVLLPRATSALALAYALDGRRLEALALATERDEQSGEAIRAMSQVASAEALLLCREITAASVRAEALVQFARTTNQIGAEAWGLLILASCHLASGRWHQAVSAAQASDKIALRQDMLPLRYRAALVKAFADRQIGTPVSHTTSLDSAILDSQAHKLDGWVRHILALGSLPISAEE